MPSHNNKKRSTSFHRPLFGNRAGATGKCRGLIGITAVLCVLCLLSVGCSEGGSAGVSERATNNNANNSDTTAGSASKATASKPKDKTVPDSETKKPAETPVQKVQVSTVPDVNDPQFHEALESVLEEYLHFGMVNSISLPTSGDALDSEDAAPKPYMSESEHEPSHGKKLYFLFARDIGHYTNPEGKPAPAGQAIVQECWTSSPSNPAARNLVKHASGNRVNPRAKVGNETLKIGQRQKFFIMTKLAKDTPDTDEGWVYGVVDADSREVVASGKIASCISCHVNGGNDRLFGSKHISFEPVIETKAPQKNSTPKPLEKESPK